MYLEQKIEYNSNDIVCINIMFMRYLMVLFFMSSLAKNNNSDDFGSVFDDKGDYNSTVIDDKGNKGYFNGTVVDDRGNKGGFNSTVVDDKGNKGRMNSSEITNESSIKVIDSMMVLCLFQLLM